MTTWKITYKQKGNDIDRITHSKKLMVEEYLGVLSLPFTDDISELRVFRNEKEYTQTLNRFLFEE